jgi:uncharacterized phage protein gp47/JayE
MTTNEVTSAGLVTQQYGEIFANFQNVLKGIYGNDINVDSNSPDGQWIGNMTQNKVDLLEVITDIYNSFDPDTAEGVVLDARVAINGIARNAGTYTIQPVEVTVDRAMTLQGLDGTGSPFTVADAAGNQFYLQSTQTPATAGTYTYNFRAVNIGAVNPLINSITSMVTVVVGVTAINNPGAVGTLGVDEESDADLKIRRQMSMAISTTSSPDSLIAALTNTSSVSGVYVWENYKSTAEIFTGTVTGTPEDGATLLQATSGATATVTKVESGYMEITSITGTFDFSHVVTGTNPITGTFTFTPLKLIEPNSIWAIVEGGSAADIGAVIYAQKSPGCNMNGIETVNVTRPNGDIFVAQYDEPIYVSLKIKFYLTAKTSSATYDPTTLKAALVSALSYNLFQAADSAGIVEALAVIAPYYSPTGVLISKDGGSNYAEIVSPNTPQHKFTIAAADITIET